MILFLFLFANEKKIKKKRCRIIKINKDKMRNKTLNKDHKPAFRTHRCVSS